MIFLSDLNHDLNQRFKSNDLNHNNPASNVSNVGIIPYMFFVPEAKPGDKKHIVGIISI